MASGKATDDIKAENEQETPVNANTFSNDGSFLQVYKQKLQEMELEKKRKEEKAKKKNEIQLKRLNNQLQGKRKGTSQTKDDLKKQKQNQDDSEKSAAWKAYMAEVNKYKSQVCTDDSETIRPLVK